MAETVKEIPVRLNIILGAGIVTLTLLQLFCLPLVLAHHVYLMMIVVLMIVPVNLPFWSLIHEAVHKNLYAGRTVNEGWGRFLSVLFGIPFAVLRFGHLMHHQFNREWETEMYTEKQNPVVAALTHYYKMLGGLYLSEVLASWALALVPAKLSVKVLRHVFHDSRHFEAAARVLLKPENLARIRIDCAATVVLYAGAFAVFKAGWPVLLLLIGGRAFIVSLMDNAYHYGTPPDNSVAAKELGVPVWLETFLLGFNHHLSHHKNPALPWNKLLRRKNPEGYTETLGDAVLAQFRGPVKISGDTAVMPAAVKQN